MAQLVETPASLSRREFLQYIWASSMLLVLGGTGGAILWFAYPRFRAGEFGGVFTLSAEVIPSIGSGPADYPDGRFWLVNTASLGVLALYKVCTHLGCLFKWVPLNNRFECPCHGSKYQLDGAWIEGPAPRSLDRFVVEALNSSGEVVAASQEDVPFAPLELPDNVQRIEINTGRRILDPEHD